MATVFGAFIRRRRESLGLTQEQLEELSGVSQNYISQFETTRKIPAQKTYAKLAGPLQVTLRELALAAAGYEPTETGGVAWIHLRGRVPADSVRWTAMQQMGQSVDIPKSWEDRARSPLFAVMVTGDCLLERRIGDGDMVVCEEYQPGRTVKNGTIVLARIDDEYTLKVYVKMGARIELRDGDGNVVTSLAEATDDYEILGTYVGHVGGDLVTVRS